MSAGVMIVVPSCALSMVVDDRRWTHRLIAASIFAYAGRHAGLHCSTVFRHRLCAGEMQDHRLVIQNRQTSA
jgi:hypothetical protein